MKQDPIARLARIVLLTGFIPLLTMIVVVGYLPRWELGSNVEASNSRLHLCILVAAAACALHLAILWRLIGNTKWILKPKDD